jgi:hypothetical protein
MTYSEFWQAYLHDHRTCKNVAFHVAGTLLAIAMLTVSVWMRAWPLAAAAIVVGYGAAWFGHFVFERNKPTAFGHPVWSLVSDLRLVFLFLSGRLQREYSRHAL